jgi:predicted dienelactone hydrolase
MKHDQASVQSTDPNTARAQAGLGKKILKWFGFFLLALVVIVGILGAVLYATALRSEQAVGFQVVRAVDAEGKPFALGIWYPSTAQPTAKWAGNFFMRVATNGPISGKELPLVVISHGTGGSITSHADLALALASAGNVVATPMHLDNFQDMTSVGTPAYITGRTKQLRATIDHMLLKWEGRQQIDSERIGAYGFSIGAFTVLTAAGAKPDLNSIAKYCAINREFACDMLRESKSFLLKAELPVGADQFEADKRIKAVVIAAPGLGFSFNSANAFDHFQLPIQLWQGDKDQSVPYSSNAKVIQDRLGHQVDFQTIANAGHNSFLVPCGSLKLSPICSDPEQFDRTAAHLEMNEKINDFFAKNLKKK